MNDPIFSLFRNGLLENVVDGTLAVRGLDFPKAKGAFPARSVLKPFQFLAADVREDRWKNPAQFAACMGSTSATESQVATLREWYKDSAYTKMIEALRVPDSYPMDEVNRVHLKDKNISPTKIFHMCFSKHMGILEGCAEHGYPFEDYTSTKHPYHNRLTEFLKKMGAAPLGAVTDGCGLPSPVIALEEMAELYFNLFSSDDPKIRRARDLMLKFPEWIGGPKRLDTKLMMANPGSLIAKEGAAGLLAICGKSPHTGKAFSIISKIDCGFYPELTGLSVAPVLTELGMKHGIEVPKGQTIEYRAS